MKFAHKPLVVAALLATLGLSAGAQTPPAGSGTGGAPMMGREGHAHGDPAKMQERMARMQEHMTQRLAAFKQKLQLTPGQEAAWNSYTAALKPTPHQRPDHAEMEKLSTPERIDRMRTLRTARLAEMDKRGEATKTFYGVLTAEQKKVFDAETSRGGRHAGGHGRGHGGQGGHHRG
ncbi:MAG TPA: Spy/CpxP family protein refolding chaperone [Ramlibacter sp.]|nr:Spy/CpxP family protein refolding chaperone [Ramlibacter sp.]